MRILGIDPGEKRIGIAVSCELALIAQGLEMIERVNLKKDIEKIVNIIEDFHVERVVVGLPKNMNGTLGNEADKVFEFISHLEKAIKIPIITWDERLSTVAVNKMLIKANMSRNKRRQVVDKLAAVYILQGYLDELHKMDE
ncbi:MAG: Holliday junction resolvase RuvX [Spirochaetota bacterium]|nr:Holliday junction resolvase RuvX [Thermodesulfobacteriota bacterium]MDY6967706.1 Holliday junction resolvase RuvX [Spirochaetota bacterium]